MQIDSHFEIPAPPDSAWPILMDVGEIAACFPGASMIEKISADQYKGRVTVKLGPLTLVFAGNLRIENRDDEAHSATVKASWTETKGRGNANSVTHFVLHAHSGGTRVAMQSDLQLAGQVAQYGRGVGMISEISAQLIAMFSENLRTQIHAADAGATVPPESRATSEISGLALIAKTLGNRLKR